MKHIYFVLFGYLLLCGYNANAASYIPLRPLGPIVRHLQPENTAIVINDDDANSIAVGEYYRVARKIPAKNIVHVHIPNNPRKLSSDAFSKLKQEIDSQLDNEIQALVLVWTAPYAVECNSITSAITLGFDAEQCIKTCAPGKPNAYFNSDSVRPFSDFGMRLSMLLPVETIEQAKALIDRGVQSKIKPASASAYFVITPDPHRNSRAPFFPKSGRIPQYKLTIKTLRTDHIEGEKDIMFYLTGLPSVTKLDTLKFLPGALADHLTSAGGDLLGNSQMSSLRWLEAGATASYGTVSEPCNYWQKFPHPSVLLKHYLMGNSAIEAYWKSVAWPAQGLFIGEALAAPYNP